MSDTEKRNFQVEMYDTARKSLEKLFGNNSYAISQKRKKNAQTVYSQYLDSIGDERPGYANLDKGGDTYSPNHFKQFYKAALPNDIRWILGVGQFGVILCEGFASVTDIESGEAFKFVARNLGELSDEECRKIRWYSYAVDFESEEYPKQLNQARQGFVNYMSAHPELVCLTLEEYGNADRFKLLDNQENDESDDDKYKAPGTFYKTDFEPAEIDGKTIRNHYHEERDGGKWYSISFVTPGSVFVYEANKAHFDSNNSNPAIEMLAIRRADFLTKGTDLEKEKWTYDIPDNDPEGIMWKYVKKIDDEHYIEVAFHE